MRCFANLFLLQQLPQPNPDKTQVSTSLDRHNTDTNSNTDNNTHTSNANDMETISEITSSSIDSPIQHESNAILTTSSSGSVFSQNSVTCQTTVKNLEKGTDLRENAGTTQHTMAHRDVQFLDSIIVHEDESVQKEFDDLWTQLI